MIWRLRSLGNRWLGTTADRMRISLVTWQRWSLKTQVAAAGAVFVLSAWLTITSISYVGNHDLLSESYGRIHTLQRAYTDLSAEAELLTTAFLEQIETLEARTEQQQAAITELTTIKAALQRQLESRERQLASVSDQRNRARGLVDDMHEAIAGAEDLLGTVAEERSALRRRLKSVEDQLAEVSGQRDASRRVEVGLRWQLAHLEDEVERLRTHRESAQLWLKDWVLGSVEALEDLFNETGVDVEQLVARAIEAPAPGQGGPLQVAAPDEVGTVGAPADDPISGNIYRLAALQRLARTLPLASPLDQFHVTSPYGKRRDPFTKAWAYHAGLDLGGPRNSKILATAPGLVIFAGRSGPYGTMVEVDHGMGIVTRYAHLDGVEVAVGDEVGFRQPVGVIGNTGRSTSRHLHYEIRIDDRAFDPGKFLDAGRLLVGVFDAPAREETR
jgi:murein DD-endopeptidase MepM/ murein hydrolase activator NlpD